MIDHETSLCEHRSGLGDAPQVTVVIVTYQSEGEIARCLDALRDSGLPLSVVLVDNASTDRTLEEAGDHTQGMRVQIVRNRTNVGFAKAVNAGIALATTGFVLVLNPDCYVQRHTIAKVMEAMSVADHVGMAGCLLLNDDNTEQAGCRRYVPTPWRAMIRVLRLHRLARWHPRLDGFLMNREPLPDRPITVEAISGAFMLLRREALDEIGLLDEGYFMHCEDLDWCMRFKQGGWKVLFVPGAKAVHDRGRSSASHPYRVEWFKHRGMVRFYLKFFRRRYPGVLLWLVVASVWARFSVVVARTALRRTFSESAYLVPAKAIRPESDQRREGST